MLEHTSSRSSGKIASLRSPPTRSQIDLPTDLLTRSASLIRNYGTTNVRNRLQRAPGQAKSHPSRAHRRWGRRPSHVPVGQEWVIHNSLIFNRLKRPSAAPLAPLGRHRPTNRSGAFITTPISCTNKILNFKHTRRILDTPRRSDQRVGLGAGQLGPRLAHSLKYCNIIVLLILV